MTYLSSLHPYPAMIANELATALAQRYITAGDVVLDPFCGTARKLLAAEAAGAAQVVGVDVNPLATLIARAKFAPASPERIRRLLVRSPRAAKHILEFENRKVPWFSKQARAGLTSIIRALNRASWLRGSDRLLVAAVLSATARHVSYCRNDQWKLHRVSRAKRRLNRDAYAFFSRRLEAAVAEISALVPQTRSRAWLLRGTCSQLGTVLTAARAPRSFNVVITSPPYGDSFSTVQYGGISSICLDVIRHVNDLSVCRMAGHEIDGCCLGAANSVSPCRTLDVGPYWAGGADNFRRAKVISFLADMGRSCRQIARAVKPRGYAILVVGRRRTGGFRVKLDHFVIDTMKGLDFQLVDAWQRPLRSKRLPAVIDRLGRAKRGSHDPISTIRTEYVVVLRRKR